jgi:hypothetical protein
MVQINTNLLMRRIRQCNLYCICIDIFFTNFTNKLDISIKKILN